MSRGVGEIGGGDPGECVDGSGWDASGPAMWGMVPCSTSFSPRIMERSANGGAKMAELTLE